MTSLTRLGVNGLLGVNSWIGVINGNLQSAGRTGYKTVRPSLIDSPSVNFLGERISIPPATINIQATTVEWAQGSIVNSNSQTHFALQGQGFFVLADEEGKIYLSRDGEFHWDGQGFLVNSNGLRVLSAGQDFIRRYRAEAEEFSLEGSSRDLQHYGNKTLMVADVANRQGLRFSRYGSTVFEIDGNLPLRVQNDFESTTDGLTFNYTDPKQRTYVDSPVPNGFIAFDPLNPGASNFQVDFGAHGVFDYQVEVGNFDPAAVTINGFQTALNNWATANNLDISVNFDPDSDRLIIRNIPEPKVVDPNFRIGNFAIDFGDNGYFVYQDFQPGSTTIANILNRINAFAGPNVTAAFDPVTGTFTLTNDVGGAGDNRIVFDGVNGDAIASLFELSNTASTGAGANTINSATPPIDRRGLTANPSAQITAQDVQSTTLSRLVNPDARVNFEGPNGGNLAQFFKFYPPFTDPAISATSGFTGLELQSRGDIDNSNILNSPVAGEHSLDIVNADLGAKSFQEYVTTSDTTYPGLDFAGPPATYSHDTTNHIVSSSGGANGHGLIGIGNSQETDQFDIVLDYRTDSPLLEFHFGFDRVESIDTEGLSLYYDTASGDVSLYQRSNDPDEPPVQIGATIPGQPNTQGLAGTPHRMAITLNRDGVLSFAVDGATPALFNLASGGTNFTGHLALGHQTNTLELHNLYADFKGFQNQDATGELVSLSRTSYSNREVNPAANKHSGPNIVQNALESSTASMTEYLPLLAHVQKVFASISKIISAGNATIDDMNSLIR